METKKEEKRETNIKKKKKIIILACILSVAVLILLGIVIGTLTYNITQKDHDVNIISAGKDDEEEEILNVELEDKKEPTLSPTEETSEPTPVVDAPYYIKVNYTANVVTVYKKDASR